MAQKSDIFLRAANIALLREAFIYYYEGDNALSLSR